MNSLDGLRGAVRADVFRCRQEQVGIVEEAAEPVVALVAEKGADVAGLVVVIDAEKFHLPAPDQSLWLRADRADTALFVMQGLIFFGGKVVVPLQVSSSDERGPFFCGEALSEGAPIFLAGDRALGSRKFSRVFDKILYAAITAISVLKSKLFWRGCAVDIYPDKPMDRYVTVPFDSHKSVQRARTAAAGTPIPSDVPWLRSRHVSGIFPAQGIRLVRVVVEYALQKFLREFHVANMAYCGGYVK